MLEIGSRLELFVDGFMIESLTGQARRRLHNPQPQEVAITFDAPWEGPLSGYSAVIVEEGCIRMYYRGWPSKDEPAVACCAESKDGITFIRPSVGVCEFGGSKDNNIIWTGPGCHNFTPMKDPNPAAPEEQRYKALGRVKKEDGKGLLPFVSPDGYRWSMLREEPVITEGAFDSQNLAFWDELRGEYLCYFRDFHDKVRDIKVCTSPDFVNWSEPEWLDYGDAPPEHLYTNVVAPYFRAPHILLGLPCRFVPSRRKIADWPHGGINDTVLMSSRDGRHWERWLEAFVLPSTDPLCWTDRNHYVAWGMVPTSDEELSLYWSEHSKQPTHRLRRGTIRTDGFVSVYADSQGGELLTRPFTFDGRRLVVNYQTSAIGSLQFEVCDPDGGAYEGFALGDSEELYGNEIAHDVAWSGGTDVTPLRGRPVRLRVALRDADLYSFRFAG